MKKQLKAIKVPDVKGRLPEAAQYAALKSMCYSSTVRDQKRQDRKKARQALKRGDWD